MREYLLHASMTGNISTGTSLRSLINRIVSQSSGLADRTSSFVLNEIPEEVNMLASEENISPVVTALLQAVLSNARNGRIRIQADQFREIIVLEIEERNNYNGYALGCSVDNLQPLARMVGGHISIKGQQKLHTTVSFSFPNVQGNFCYDC